MKNKQVYLSLWVVPLSNIYRLRDDATESLGDHNRVTRPISTPLDKSEFRKLEH